MDAELNKQIEQLEDENYSLKAEIERLRDLQSPEHARLWEASKAAMQGMIAGSAGLHITTEQFAERSVALARALIAEVDGSPSAPATVTSKGAKNEPGSGPVPQREAPEGVRLWEPDAKGDGDFDFAQLGQKGAKDVATALLMSNAARSTHDIDGENFKVTVVATLGEGAALSPVLGGERIYVAKEDCENCGASRRVRAACDYCGDAVANLTQGPEIAP